MIVSTQAPGSQPPDTLPHGRRILVCLDRSTFSEGCLPYAISLAKTFGGAVTLLHVMQPHHEHSGPQAHDALGWEIARQEARAYLERLKRVASNVLQKPVEVRLEQGHPAERIIDLAHQIDADLTVLGSHGEAGVTPWNLGSTVQQVLAVVRNSVLIIHPSAGDPREVALKRILIPLDGSLRTESVLPVAAHLATAHEAELLLVHVVQEPVRTTLLHTSEDMELAHTLASHLQSRAQRYLEHLQQQLAHEGVSARTLVLTHANERQCLLEVSRKEQTDLIVLSAHGSGCDSERSFGSVTVFLLTHSMVPLLVLQDLPECELVRQAQEADSTARPSLRASYAPENA